MIATNTKTVSSGVMEGSRSAYETYTLASNQENNPIRRDNATAGSFRQRSNSNLRMPFPATSTSNQGVSDTGRMAQYRAGEQGQIYGDGSKNTKIPEQVDPPRTNNTSRNANGAELYDDIPENMYKPEQEDLAGWIHREKLAKIENEELQAAGINLAKARSRSRDALGGRVRDTSKDFTARDNSNNVQEAKKQKLSTLTDHDTEEDNDRQNWDFRTPDEIAADDAAGRVYASPVLRKSGSKIPILTSSPTPIPSDRYERETPMPRKRTISDSLTPDDVLAASNTKITAGNRENGGAGGSSQSGSPVKTKSKAVISSRPGTASGLKTVPTARKTSVTTKVVPSTQQNNGRPGTRGNDMERPKTAVNRPEGDPPWLATMYKPDPKLPPEEQLIPTLAKKQQQQQWAASGQIPKTYDRDFNSLAVHDAEQDSYVLEPSSPHEEETVQKQDDSTAWPLKPLPTSNKTTSPNRPPTSSGVTGGYSTMPKVASPPVSLAQSPRIGSTSNEVRMSNSGPGPTASTGLDPRGSSAATKIQSHRLQHSTDAQDEKVEKKGCCCIVM